MNTPMENALLLISSIRSALANGIIHTNLAGKELKTEKEILEALLEDGEILIQNAEVHTS